MSDLPPIVPYRAPFPESDQLPDPARHSVGGFIAWVLILICVGLVVVRVQLSYKRAAAEGITNPSSELQVQFSGKTAVGLQQMLGGGATKQNQEQMLQALDKYAETPAEKVRAIIVIAELKGADQALDRIEKLQTDPKVKRSKAVEEDLWALRRIYTSGLSSLDDASKQRLVERHGFFGRLADAYGLKDSDPGRAKVLAEAHGAAVLMMVMGVLVIVLLGLVLAAVVTAIVLVATGIIRRLYVPQPWANSAFVEGFALYLVAFIALGYTMNRLGADSLAWDWIALVLIPIVIGWIKWRGLPGAEARRGLGWYWGRGPFIEIPMGIFGYFAGVPVIIAGFLISMLLMKHAQVSPMHPIQKMLEGNKWHVLNLYGIACVFAPILEETMFRGALFNHMRRRWNWLISASLVALIFASIHPQGWTLIPALGSIAIVLAGLREWRGAIWAPIAAHATNNFLVLSFALMAAR